MSINYFNKSEIWVKKAVFGKLIRSIGGTFISEGKEVYFINQMVNKELLPGYKCTTGDTYLVSLEILNKLEAKLKSLDKDFNLNSLDDVIGRDFNLINLVKIMEDEGVKLSVKERDEMLNRLGLKLELIKGAFYNSFSLNKKE